MITPEIRMDMNRLGNARFIDAMLTLTFFVAVLSLTGVYVSSHDGAFVQELSMWGSRFSAAGLFASTNALVWRNSQMQSRKL